MSTYRIGAETFLRLANVLSFFEPTLGEETRKLINTIRLENKDGRSVAVVTNNKIAVIEALGKTDFADGVCHVALIPQLMEAAKRAADRGLPITFTLIPEIAMSTAQIGPNEFIGDVAYWFDETPLNDWRSWVVPSPAASSGIMAWDLFHVETLIRSSPSAKILFPEFVDAHKPVLLRDRYKDYWVGIFIPSFGELPPDTVRIIKENLLPDWVK